MKFNISSTFYLNMNFNVHLLKALEYLKINIDSLVHVLLYVNKKGIFLHINIAITIKTILLFKEDKYKTFLVICINRQTRKQRIKLLNNGESTRFSFFLLVLWLGQSKGGMLRLCFSSKTQLEVLRRFIYIL